MKESRPWSLRTYSTVQGAYRCQATRVQGCAVLPSLPIATLHVPPLQHGDTEHDRLFVQLFTHCKILDGRDSAFSFISQRVSVEGVGRGWW